MKQPSLEILYNPLALTTLSTRKISSSLAAHCGRGASFCELRDSVAQLPLPGPVRQALMTEDENFVCAETANRLGRFIGMLEGNKGIRWTRIYDDEETVCVHVRKNRLKIVVRGDSNERELVFAEAAEAEEFWREFEWILCNTGHLVASLVFRIADRWPYGDNDPWPHNSYDWFPPTFLADILKAALETETPTNIIPTIIVEIPPNAGVRDPTVQLIAEQAQHIQLTSAVEGIGEGVESVFRGYQLMSKKIAGQTFYLNLEIKNGQLCLQMIAYLLI